MRFGASTNVLWFLLVVVATPAMTQQGLAKPNILFVMADDHTYQAIGAYGSRLAKLDPTPTIDDLARNGMRFDRVFCTNSRESSS